MPGLQRVRLFPTADLILDPFHDFAMTDEDGNIIYKPPIGERTFAAAVARDPYTAGDSQFVKALRNAGNYLGEPNFNVTVQLEAPDGFPEDFTPPQTVSFPFRYKGATYAGNPAFWEVQGGVNTLAARFFTPNSPGTPVLDVLSTSPVPINNTLENWLGGDLKLQVRIDTLDPFFFYAFVIDLLYVPDVNVNGSAAWWILGES